VRARDRSRFIVRLPIASRAPDKALVDAARSREMGSNRSPTGSPFTEAKHSAKYLPERLPYFELLVPGPQGEVWIQVYSGNRLSAAQYVVIDSAGRPRGRVSVPAGNRVREAGLEYVILVHQDQDGVESVRVHRLERR
jgi:hypothetical protein